MKKSKDRILVIDDESAFLKMMEELLKEQYEVSLAKSGRQAVRFLEKNRHPALILLDIDMPDMDGFETLLKLRAVESEPEMPVIYLTGISGSDSEVQGFRLGAVDYIKKPVARDVLLARISHHLAQAKSLHKLDVLRKSQGRTGGLQPDKLLQMEEFLTKTEFAVATLAAQGYTNDEISRMLNYSRSYVKKVVSRVFDRLDICKRSEVKRFFT